MFATTSDPFVEHIVEISIYIFDNHDNKNYQKTPTIEIDLPKGDIETSSK